MLSDTIKQIRRKNYLNQTEFAQKIGVSQSAVSQWEHDLTRPNSYQLEAISKTFNISIDELLVDKIKENPSDVPRTPEARLLAKGVDTMSEDQRKAFLNFAISMRPDVFKKGNNDDET